MKPYKLEKEYYKSVLDRYDAYAQYEYKIGSLTQEQLVKKLKNAKIDYDIAIATC